MIYSLRQRHRLIWSVLAGLLPLGFLAIVWLTPTQSAFNVPPPPSNKQVKEIGLQENAEMCVRLVESKTEQKRWLEVQLKEEVSIPLPYLLLQGPNGQKQALGALHSRGKAHYIIPENLRFAPKYRVALRSQLTKEIHSDLEIHLK